MRVWLRSLMALILALCSAGCGLIRTGTEVVAHKSWQALDDCAEHLRNRRWAKEAWREATQCCPPGSYSTDYEKGFKDGFASFLYRGGTGEPPPVPPCEYRKLCYQTPEGYQAVLDWYAGYRHGSWVARQRGYRDLVTGPSVLRTVPPPAAPPAGEPLSPPAHHGEPPIGPAPVQPELPPAAPPIHRQLPPPMRELPPPHPQDKDEVKPTAGMIMTIDFAPWRK